MTDVERRAWTEEDESKHKRGTGAQGGQFVAHDGGNAKPGQGHRPMKPKAAPAKPQPAKQQLGTKPQPKQQVGTAPKAKTSGRGPAQTPADIKPDRYRGPLKIDGENDPDQVRELQALLKALGLSTRNATGAFDRDTENAVKQAQFRLGLKPTGRASAALVRKMMAAHALSPCIKRSGDLDCSDLVRAEFPHLSAALDAGQLDEEEIVRADEILRYERTWALDGIEIIRGGDGRTVEAYAAVFDSPAEVRDQHGHYMEDIDRAAFNREITRSRPQGGREHWLTNVFYNHGADLNGRPNGLLSVPLGSPIDIRADGRGLLTVTRYNKSELADTVLEAIRNGDIRAQSFRGRIYKSDKRAGTRGELPTVRRMELGLAEYGPTPSAVYAGAAILAVRSVPELAHDLAQLDADAREQLVRALTLSAPQDSEAQTATPEEDEGLGAEDSPVEALRSAAEIRRRARAALITRSIK
jgi:phage head maturation protease